MLPADAVVVDQLLAVPQPEAQVAVALNPQVW